MQTIVADDPYEGLAALVRRHTRLLPHSGGLRGNCPFCQQGVFHVNTARQVWYCFGCSRGGDRDSFIEQISEEQ